MRSQEYIAWKQLQTTLKNSLDKCLVQITTKLIQTESPPNFQSIVNEIKLTIQNGIDFQRDEFMPIYLYMIEERQCIELKDLAKQFVNNFGLAAQIWEYHIKKWAQQIKYTPSLSIWKVYDNTKIEYLTNSFEREKIKNYRVKAKSYASSLYSLVCKIQNLNLSHSPYAVDQLYVRYYKQKVVYQTFASTCNLVPQQNLDQVTMTYKGKSQAQKKMFNLHQGIHSLVQQEKKPHLKTLESYNFKLKTNSNIDTKQMQQKRINQYKKTKLIVESIGKQVSPLSINDLLDELKAIKEQRIRDSQKNKPKQQQTIIIIQPQGREMDIDIYRIQQSSQNLQNLQNYTNQPQQNPRPNHQRRQAISHFTYIFNDQYYFNYQGYPITLKQSQSTLLNYAQPFKTGKNINYLISQSEEFEQLEGGVDLENEIQDSDEQQEYSQSNGSFIDNNSRIYNEDGEIVEYAKTKHQDEDAPERWAASVNSQNIVIGDKPKQPKCNIIEIWEIKQMPKIIPLSYEFQIDNPLKMKRNRRKKSKNPRHRKIKITESDLELSFASQQESQSKQNEESQKISTSDSDVSTDILAKEIKIKISLNPLTKLEQISQSEESSSDFINSKSDFQIKYEERQVMEVETNESNPLEATIYQEQRQKMEVQSSSKIQNSRFSRSFQREKMEVQSNKRSTRYVEQHQI